MTWTFKFPPEPTSETHAYHTGITHFTPDIVIRVDGDSYYGTAPNQIRRELWGEMRGMTADQRARLVQERTGIKPIIDDPQPIIGPFGLEA